MKELFKEIYAYLTKVGLKFDQIEAKVNNIPNFDGLTKSIKDLEKRMAENERRTRNNEEKV